jgi:uncharacterized membrane protein YfcA
MPSLPLPDLPLAFLIAIPLIVLAGYTIFGATGFGSAIVSVPLLAHLVSLTTAVATMTSLDFFAANHTAWQHRHSIAWHEFRRIAPAAVVGIALGGTLLLNLPPAPALLALAIFVGVYGVYVLSGAPRPSHAPVWLALPLGVVGGIFSCLFGTGGPVYVIYLSARIHDKGALRATAAIMVVLSVWLRLAIFIATGLVHGPLLVLVAMLLPAMALGLWLGQKLHQRLSSAGVLRLIAVLLVANAVTLLVRVLA